MSDAILHAVVTELRSRPGALAGIAGAKTYTAAEVPVELDPASLPKEIVGELLRAGERAVIGSTSKSRKSWALLHLAVCKAHGLPWLGHPMKPGKVLYVDLELIKVFFDRRMAAICKQMNVTHPGNLLLWPLRNTRPKPTIEQLVTEVVKRFKDEQLELVILEPSYKMVEPSVQGTNSEMLVAKYLECLDEIAHPLQCAVITSHHSPKGDLSSRNSIDLFSGTGVWARDPDLLCTMRPHEKDEHVIFDITRRHGAPLDPVVLAWQYPLHQLAPDEDPTKIRTTQSGQKSENSDKVRAALETAGEAGDLSNEWKSKANELGVADATFYRRKKDLTKTGEVVVLQDDRGKTRYRLAQKNGLKHDNPF